jgi:phenylacetic acid degradation operon negative regulatory protein
MRAQLKTSTAGGPQSAWAIDVVRGEYDRFIGDLERADGLRGAAALAARSQLMLTWLRFRSDHVGLPRELLPEDWPRLTVARRFAERYDELGPEAETRMRLHVGALAPELAASVRARRLAVD